MLATATSRNNYVTVGSVGPYPYTFKIWAASDLRVVKRSGTGVETVLNYPADFSVTGIGKATGGSITLTVAPGGADTLSVRRLRPLTQTTDLRNQSTYFREDIEDALDKLMMIHQQQQEELNRSFRLKEGLDSSAYDLLVPVGVAGQVIGWGVNGLTNLAVSAGAVALPGNGRTVASLSAYLANNAVYNPKDWGVLFDGVTNDTARWIVFMANIPAADFVVWFPMAATPSMIDQTTAGGLLAFTNKNNFRIYGNKAQIKVINGAACTSGNYIMAFTGCVDGFIDNLILDANRAGRAPNLAAPAAAYSVYIADNNQRLVFDTVRAPNSVIDGFTVVVSGANLADLTKYPTEITLRNCEAPNAVRCGLSPINSNKLLVQGGRYNSANGALPEAGIDAEPDIGFVSFGNQDMRLLDVETSDNNGPGLQLSGWVNATNKNAVVRGHRGKNNATAFILIACCDGLELDFDCGPHAASTRGIVDFAAGSVIGVHLTRGSWTDITANDVNNACLYVHSGVVDTPSIKNVTFKRTSCRTLWLNRRCIIDGYYSLLCTKSPEAQLVSGESEFRNATSESGTGISLYVDAADVMVDNFKSIDCAHVNEAIYVSPTGVRSSIYNSKVLQRTAIPGGTQVGIYYDAIPKVLSNFEAKSAGTDYTRANVATFAAGLSTAKVTNVTPSPFRFINLAVANAAFVDITIPAGMFGPDVVLMLYIKVDLNPTVTGVYILSTDGATLAIVTLNAIAGIAVTALAGGMSFRVTNTLGGASGIYSNLQRVHV